MCMCAVCTRSYKKRCYRKRVAHKNTRSDGVERERNGVIERNPIRNLWNKNDDQKENWAAMTTTTTTTAMVLNATLSTMIRVSIEACRNWLVLVDRSVVRCERTSANQCKSVTINDSGAAGKKVQKLQSVSVCLSGDWKFMKRALNYSQFSFDGPFICISFLVRVRFFFALSFCCRCDIIKYLLRFAQKCNKWKQQFSFCFFVCFDSRSIASSSSSAAPLSISFVSYFLVFRLAWISSSSSCFSFFNLFISFASIHARVYYAIRSSFSFCRFVSYSSSVRKKIYIECIWCLLKSFEHSRILFYFARSLSLSRVPLHAHCSHTLACSHIDRVTR